MSEPATPPSSRLSGGCRCGAVRDRVSGAPIEVSICHCRMCQKAGGGLFLALAKFPLQSVERTRGVPAIFTSSSFATRGFCAACGTPLTYQWEPEAISLTTGSFDEPVAVPPFDPLRDRGPAALVRAHLGPAFGHDGQLARSRREADIRQPSTSRSRHIVGCGSSLPNRIFHA